MVYHGEVRWYDNSIFGHTFWLGDSGITSLKTLGTDFCPTLTIFARCSTALAARSFLRELSEVSAWVQTRGVMVLTNDIGLGPVSSRNIWIVVGAAPGRALVVLSFDTVK